MKSIPHRSNVFQQVKVIPIQEVLERYGVVMHGKYAPCPFHDDHRPSFYVYDDGFYCFACGANGDSVSFVARLLNVRPLAAAHDIAARFGLPVEQIRDRQQVKEELKAATERIEAQRALRGWAHRAYVKLVAYRRCLWLVLETPDDLRADWCDRLLYCDHILDELQFGTLADKQANQDAAQAGKLGLLGMVIAA